MVAEQKYDRGACVRGCEAADYPREASTCEGQKLEGLKPPPPPPPWVLPPLGRRVEGKDNGRQKEGGGVKDKTKEACTHTKDNLATKAKSKT